MRVLRRAIAVVLALVLVLGACGDDAAEPDPAADLAAAGRQAGSRRVVASITTLDEEPFSGG